MKLCIVFIMQFICENLLINMICTVNPLGRIMGVGYVSIVHLGRMSRMGYVRISVNSFALINCK